MIHPSKEIMRELINYTIKNAKEDNETGCFIVKDDKIVCKAISTTKHDPTAHGEINAISKYCRSQKDYYALKDAWVYSTQIPCPMCSSAIVWSLAKGIVFGWDGRHTWSETSIHPQDVLKTANHKMELIGPFLEDECLKIKGYRKR